jgi:hypothetical protein
MRLVGGRGGTHNHERRDWGNGFEVRSSIFPRDGRRLTINDSYYAFCGVRPVPLSAGLALIFRRHIISQPTSTSSSSNSTSTTKRKPNPTPYPRKLTTPSARPAHPVPRSTNTSSTNSSARYSTSPPHPPSSSSAHGHQPSLWTKGTPIRNSYTSRSRCTMISRTSP